MDNLFSNNLPGSRPSPHERWKTLYEQSISFQTFGIPVEPPYIDMDSIPAIAELDSEANNQAKQELLNFCHTLLRTRHQSLYMHINNIEQATAMKILHAANKISKKFLDKAVEHIEKVQNEVQENGAYEAIRDMEDGQLRPYLLAVAVKMAKLADVPEFNARANKNFY